jgi:hypothetical protein
MVSIGVVVAVESITVLSDDPETLLVELHAEAASIIEPAIARLKIVLFMVISLMSFDSQQTHC